MSASEIASELSNEFKRPITRNAILGVFNRAGKYISSMNGENPGRGRKRTPGARKPRIVADAKTKQLAPVESKPLEIIIDELNPELNAPLMELRENQCHWMVDDTATPPMYCGSPVVGFRKSYCSIHAARARGHLKPRRAAQEKVPYRRARGRWT